MQSSTSPVLGASHTESCPPKESTTFGTTVVKILQQGYITLSTPLKARGPVLLRVSRRAVLLQGASSSMGLLRSTATERLDGLKRGCEFCEITEGKNATRVFYQTPRLTVFRDRNPGAKVHLLVIPNNHIATMACLRPSEADFGLVQEMAVLGEKLVRGLSPDAPVKLGFHMPPWNSVDHLHLHAFGLPHCYPHGFKYNVTRGATLGYITAAQLLERLRPPGEPPGGQDGSDSPQGTQPSPRGQVLHSAEGQDRCKGG